MDSFLAFICAQRAAAIGAKQMAFDWDKAATIIKERQPVEAAAGLKGDYEYTCGLIFRNGVPFLDDYVYLSSNWAKPMLIIGDEEIECWRYDEGYDPNSKWPQSALELLK